MPIDEVSKLTECVRTYNKTMRQAKKETREAFKKMLVESQLKKMKEGGEKNNGVKVLRNRSESYSIS